MIQALLLSDIDELAPLLIKNYSLVGDILIYGEANADKMKDSLSRFLKRPDFFAWVIKNEAREITGIIAWFIHPNTYSEGECASEMIWYAYKPRDMVRLMKFSLNRIPENLHIAVGHYPDNHALKKWLARKGFAPSRLIHVKKHKGGN
jgi:hypothetical protein